MRPVLPAETSTRDGLAYTLWLPDEVRGGLVILHGADSCKESHHDFARKALPLGLASVSFDQRGHGASPGPLDAHAVEDVASMASLLREATGDHTLPIALRGSSMGGYLALVAAAPAGAGAVVAICPASGDGLARGLRSGRFEFDADVDAFGSLLDAHDLTDVTPQLTMPVLLMHAEGDERVPIEHSRRLAAMIRSPGSRLIAVPGGHHRSVQHDEELQAVSVLFIQRALGARRR